MNMIYTEEDCSNLQNDIDKAYKWTENSLLKFHPDKYKRMRIANTNRPDRTYNINDDFILANSEKE